MCQIFLDNCLKISIDSFGKQSIIFLELVKTVNQNVISDLIDFSNLLLIQKILYGAYPWLRLHASPIWTQTYPTTHNPRFYTKFFILHKIFMHSTYDQMVLNFFTWLASSNHHSNPLVLNLLNIILVHLNDLTWIHPLLHTWELGLCMHIYLFFLKKKE